MKHRLDPLLRPASIAVVGASERPDSVGRQTVENLQTGGYEGALFAVNPGYEAVLGVPCFANMAALPQTVEHVIFAVGDARIEAALEDAVAHGARAATIMTALVLARDRQPLLRDRIAAKIRAAEMLVCGANGMGFYNFHDGVWSCGFDTRNNHVRGGNVTLISHSGSGMCGILDCEERIDFNLAVSTGQELGVTMDEYMDFALDLPGTRVIGLFMETARNPAGLIAAFEKAHRKAIPVVVLKVGRTELAARLTVSHSGAIAGRDDTYQALFDRHGVQRVQDMDELATALIMFAQPHPVAAGGLAAIHDSGGERQHLIDLADAMDVPLAEISRETGQRLAELLDPGLLPVNPLDAWGAGGPNANAVMENSLAALMADPGTALGAVVHDRAPLGRVYPCYAEYLRKGHAASGKPVFLVANRQGTGADPRVIEFTREGFPVLDGLRSFLAGVRCLLGYRDFLARPPARTPAPDPDLVRRWRPVLAGGDTLDELQAGELMAGFGIPVNPGLRATDEATAAAAAAELGYPVALKSMQEGLLHKTDQAGVVLDISDEDGLRAAYRDLASRLGPAALVSPMISGPGTEMVLGMVRDEQFGPLVMLGFGGINVQALEDMAYALPPFDEATARRLVDGLRLRDLLDARRNRPAADIAAFCRAAARFSVLVAGLGGVLREIDLNPVIVNSSGCTAVDALVVGHAAAQGDNVDRRAQRTPGEQRRHR
jgi:acyl-CoA synthetase (NDP forming)